MFSKFVVVLSVVLLPVLGIPAQASNPASTLTATTDGDSSGGIDCFYEENRYKPECQNK